MTIDWLSPSALWALVLVPLVWVTERVRIGGRPIRVGQAHAVSRAVLIAVLVTALAEPVVTWSASRVSVIHVVDVSYSVSARALDTVADAIDRLSEALNLSTTRILVFGGQEAVVSGTEELRSLSGAPDADAVRAAVPEATNLEQALAAARAEILAGTSGRIVLFSDGRETEGDVRRVVDRLAAEGIPVFVQGMPSRDLGDTWVEAVRMPGPVVAKAPAVLEVVLGSQVAGAADVVVRDGAETLARRQVTVLPGETVVSLEAVFAWPGAHVVEVDVRTGRAVLPENDTLRQEIVVLPQTRVLYVRGDPAATPTAASALVHAGALVTIVEPTALPRATEGFDQWDVVVLSNVARADLATPAMAALAAWVEDRGGGLLFVGGDRVLGESTDPQRSGYRRTDLERILPVTFDRDDEPEVALVIVLDRSWSMNGLAMDLSKSAAEAAANTLAPTQMLGILTFNNLSTWDVPLARVRDSRPTLRDAISRITASGATAIYPALAQAFDALSRVRARAKHVILLSDGQTEPQDYEGLVRQMSAARITVSSVALGTEADVTLLRNIAAWGGGRHYVVADARQVPEIFVREARNAETPGAEQGAEIPLAIEHPGFFPAVGPLPPVAGRNTVTGRPDAIELIATTRGDPLLSAWPAGLGRTAMLATDLDGRWSNRWLQWQGFGGLLSTVVRSLASSHVPSVRLMVEPGARQGAAQEVRIVIDARDRDGRPRLLSDPRVTLEGRGTAVTARLTQTGAARYGTRLMADTSEPIAVRLEGEAAGEAPATRVLVTDQAAEYRFGPADTSLLREIAATTGGTVDPSAADLGRDTGSGTVRHALAPWLLGIALMLWPIDILVRRRWR